MSKKVLIVGGVAGGASAAARLRRLDEEAQIIMFERDEYISFANCGLPYYIGENIKDRSKLLIQTPQAMKERFNIDVRINSEVTAVDTENKKITVRSREKGVYEETYDYLILSPGARAIRPNIPGIDSNKVFVVRNIPDTDAIKSYVDKKGVQSAIVVGGGFIGVEMAENLKERELDVTLVEAAPHILPPFDSDTVVLAEKELSDNGVQLILKDGIKAFEEIGSQIEVTLASDTKLTTDMVILAIGVSPETAFIKNSGIELGPKGHIVVNERMQTNKEGVFAVGDAVEVVDFVSKQKTAIPLAGPANKQGRIAADNVAGLQTEYKGTQGTSILKIFGLTAASTGSNEKNLRKAGIPYKVLTLHPASHASYYPGALQMTLKLLFNEEGRILGAQIIGYDGVDKRIDVIATVLRLNGTVEDLTELELAYAPPFSSAKDPVNMAGYAAQNVLEGRSSTVTWFGYLRMDKSDFVLVDVRSKIEYENGHIEGAINIPVDELRDRLGELDKNKKIVEYCQVGLRGYVAERILKQNGFDVLNVTGGYRSAAALNFKPEKVLSATKQRVILEPDTQAVRPDTNKDDSYDRALDACGLCCPGPLMQVKANLDELEAGQVLKVTATDAGFFEDIKAWCKRTNNELMSLNKSPGEIIAFIRKGMGDNPKTEATITETSAKDNKTMVVFSGELDKAIASFIIANGAASMGKKVTMFFTFWGLNILRRPEKVDVDKSFIGKMFSAMMPRGSRKLKLSNMNMMGMGAKMIRGIMKNNNVLSLEELIQSAIDSGVELVACQMSMDLMGITESELIDGVKLGGVGYMLGEAEDSDVNFFI
ncbi:CoA-disulfide reductase [Parasporobacterium paucivorans]|uniref:NADPH-dependent 2,4-dienoyl-CoA reductase, sulfur reductase n=1 Tax=Parasporobacterium paucivorans DSM 15970 TaxID=1122934 RepID=A0A1M6DJN8_9FIRM|nr:CoA-disulfide reductase [Parasporobacterium paucivorans]SHI73218.1 NADPH-dependent 2,4-dienoyl-CoA reductase, sulfur reductase [Parasporobacterium paucivorans DSM 15970]